MTDAAAARDAASQARPIILLVGAVGAGKGTQASILERELGIVHLASGDLFRDALRRDTPLGRQAHDYMARGDLVPDEITIAIFMQRMAEPDAAAGALLDGFPRTVAQARALDLTLGERDERVSHLLFIEIPPDEIVRRVAGRLVCPVCETPYHVETSLPRVPGRCDREGAELVQREDDRPDVVRARLAKQIPPMLDVVHHYEGSGVVTRVDGRQPIDDVTAQILAAVGQARTSVPG